MTRDLDIGDELGVLEIVFSSEAVRAYAHAAHMPGGRFLSDEEAQKEGLPGQIAPGNLSLALFSRLLAESLPGKRLRRLSGTFRALVRPNVPLRVHGVVTEKYSNDNGNFVECDLLLETTDGDRLVTGTATVEL